MGIYCSFFMELSEDLFNLIAKDFLIEGGKFKKQMFGDKEEGINNFVYKL